MYRDFVAGLLHCNRRGIIPPSPGLTGFLHGTDVSEEFSQALGGGAEEEEEEVEEDAVS